MHVERQEMSTAEERRRFHRFPFDAECELKLNDQSIACHLMDISINGMLVRLDSDRDCPLSTEGHLHLQLTGTLDDQSVDIRTVVCAVRVHKRLIACRFEAIDPDSFDQLKLLIERNLGDVLLLDRELTQLDYWPGLSISPAGGE